MLYIYIKLVLKLGIELNKVVEYGHLITQIV